MRDAFVSKHRSVMIHLALIWHWWWCWCSSSPAYPSNQPVSQANNTMRHGFRVHFSIRLPFYVNAIIISFSFCGLFSNCFKRIKPSCVFNFLSFLNGSDSFKSLIPLCWLIGFFFPCFSFFFFFNFSFVC